MNVKRSENSIQANEKGSSLVEMLFAFAFIGITIGTLMQLAIVALKASNINLANQKLGQVANLVSEQIVIDYQSRGDSYVNTKITNTDYCLQFLNYVSAYPNKSCSVVRNGDGDYSLALSLTLHQKTVGANRKILLK